MCVVFFFFAVTATSCLYTFCHTLSPHDALPVLWRLRTLRAGRKRLSVETAKLPTAPVLWHDGDVDRRRVGALAQHPERLVGLSQREPVRAQPLRSEEHTSELQTLMRISYAVLCLKKKNDIHKEILHHVIQ